MPSFMYSNGSFLAPNGGKGNSFKSADGSFYRSAAGKSNSLEYINGSFFAYGAFDVPGVALDLSFLTPGVLPSGVTFTRASAATYIDANGVLQTAATNVPRWGYDPATHALRGLAIDEARTNLILQSQFAASWTPTNVTLTPNAVTSPDGTATAATMLETTANGQHNLVQSVTKAASVLTYGVSVFAKQGVGTRTLTIQVDKGGVGGVKCVVNPTSGRVDADVAPIGSGWSGTPVVVTTLPNGWFRFAFTVTTDATTTIRTIINLTIVGGFTISYVGDGVSNVQVYGDQLELGAFPTSYIATTTTSATRAAETATIPIGAWFNALQGTLAADYMVAQSPNPSATLVRDACALSDGTASNRLILRGENIGANTGAFATSIAGVNTSSAALGNVVANGVSKIAAAWNGTIAAGSLNSSAVASYAVGMPAGLTTLTLGNDYAGAPAYLNGHIRRVRYWPRALNADELQSVTT